MTIDWNAFTPWASLAGGLLIGRMRLTALAGKLDDTVLETVNAAIDKSTAP